MRAAARFRSSALVRARGLEARPRKPRQQSTSRLAGSPQIAFARDASLDQIMVLAILIGLESARPRPAHDSDGGAQRPPAHNKGEAAAAQLIEIAADAPATA
jgi:hypothetical protein